jgi:hypothetical protein
MHDLKQHLWCAKALCAVPVHTVTNFCMLPISASNIVLQLYFMSQAKINQPERATVGVEIVPAGRSIRFSTQGKKMVCSKSHRHEVVWFDVAVYDMQPRQ